MAATVIRREIMVKHLGDVEMSQGEREVVEPVQRQFAGERGRDRDNRR